MATNGNDAPALVSATGQAAPQPLAAALGAAGQLLHARPGQLLLSAGTRSDDVYLVRSGAIRVTLYSGDGREVIIRDQGVGNFFGELAAVDGGRAEKHFQDLVALAPTDSELERASDWVVTSSTILL